jgi:hypothetical protein
MCVKEGSWAVLADLYPKANCFPVYRRFGKIVRFYPPPFAAVPSPIIRYCANAVLFPCYSKASKAQIIPIEPYDVLAELIKSNSIIDHWTPEKFESVSAWVSSLSGYRLIYPDLLSGMNLVRQIFREFE